MNVKMQSKQNVFQRLKNWTFGEQTFNNMFRPRRMEDGTYFYPIQGSAFHGINYVKDFLEIPETGAVLSLKANMYSNGCFKVVNKDDVEKKNDVINKKLKRPNWFQTQREFMKQTCLFHDICGNEYLYMFFGVGMQPTIDNISGLYTLPPYLVKPKYKDALPFYLHSADDNPNIIYEVMSAGGERTILPANEIIHLNDNRVLIKNMSDPCLLEGTSNMQSLTPQNNNMRMAYESRHIILKYRGALGILSSDATEGTGAVLPIDEDEKKIIQDGYKQYGGLGHQNAIIITSASVKWQSIIVNPDKLGLWKETEEGLCATIDKYGMDRDQFCSEKGATFENKNQADKRVYQNTIIPQANERIESLNDVLMEGSNYRIIVDYSHLPIFQEDIKMRADALNSMVNALSLLYADKQITADEYREELHKRFEIGDGKAVVVPELPTPDPTATPPIATQPTN